ncbi:hypothetical protein MSAN_02204100 [Mycena sanguinolenta]|uniref:Uncharacterized protein n=1 Tax=Mycena sanguinolenta TaxID=230812 RepID=A0A8H7CID6_9AGAR|nr:hypothetical protein MSAN_02204100 [Mycena sanguinolenta]
MPQLPALTHLFWAECSWSVLQLNAILAAAPSLWHLALTGSGNLSSGYRKGLTFQLSPGPEFLPLRCLRSLNLVRLSTDCVHALLAQGVHFGQLTHLTITPMHFEWESFPVLPALRVLSLVVDSSDTATIPFHAVLDRCRSVEELRYGARDTPVAPYETQVAAKLLCVRIYLDARMSWRRRGWRAASRLHATLLLRSTFGALRRVVLDGSGWLEDESPEWPEWALLRERGCRVEYPNHKGE